MRATVNRKKKSPSSMELGLSSTYPAPLRAAEHRLFDLAQLTEA